MAGAQPRTSDAPFASSRDRGFLYRTQALKRGTAALSRAWRSNSFPVVFEGPEGLGKATLVAAWLGQQPRGTITPAALAGEDLVPGHCAARILLAFGQKPSGNARAEDALCDFLEDCVFDGRPGFLLVSDLQRAPVGVWKELRGLAAPRPEGGIGLPLCVTTTRAPAGSGAIPLPAMSPSESKRFIDAVMSAAGEAGRSPGRALAERLIRECEGLPGRLGPALDRALSSGSGAGTGGGALVPEDPQVADEPADERLPSVRDQAPTGVPTPEDIEKALLALGQQPADTAELPSGPAREFPRIATGTGVHAPRAANDPAERLAPRVARGLETVAAEIAALQGHLLVVRDQAQALSRRLDERKRLREEAAGAFADAITGPGS